MYIRDRWRRIGGAAMLAALSGGCFRTTAPRGWLPTADETQQTAYGAWASVTPMDPAAGRLEGELIAVDRDSIHVMRGASLASLTLRDVRSVRLTTYDQRASELGLWTVLGIVSTASHGVGLLLTAPTWAVVGSLSTAAATHGPEVTEKGGLAGMQKFARFPQGIPATLDRGTLTPKR